MTGRVVVIGGTGHFGGRICRRITGEPGISLVVTSRAVDKAAELARELQGIAPHADVTAAALDQSSPSFEQDLATLDPAIVIHTAGPYQGQDYRVAEACIACNSHYIDLADGRDFVAGFDVLDARAKSSGVMLVSGASTLPGLSSAVVAELGRDLSSIQRIEISIAPAHQTPRGPGTIGAVLSYCGRPFQVLEDGDWVTRYGWQDLRRQTYPHLGTRLSAACDVPDLGLLASRVTDDGTVTFHAALEAKWEQLALWLMAWISRLRLVPDWSRFVPGFRWLSDRLIGLGSDRGGMRVRLAGVDGAGNPVSRSWYLTARQNHGPEIPCTPALILARRLAAGGAFQPGAFACMELITLREFDAEVDDLDIDWEVVEDPLP